MAFEVCGERPNATTKRSSKRKTNWSACTLPLCMDRSSPYNAVGRHGREYTSSYAKREFQAADEWGNNRTNSGSTAASYNQVNFR